MKTLLLALAIAASAALAPVTTTLAADDAATATSALPLVRAEVRKVDAANGRITLRHDEIPNLDMGGMTMTFRLADPKLAAGLEPGTAVRVTIDRVKGQLTVMSLERAQ